MPDSSPRGYTPPEARPPIPAQEKPQEKTALLSMELDDGSTVELWNFERHVLDKLPPGLSSTEQALAILENRQYTDNLARELKRFSGLNAEVANALIDRAYADSVVKNMDRFDASAQKEIALKLIRTNQISLLLTNLDRFHDLDQEMFFEILRRGTTAYSTTLMSDENIERFHVDRAKAIRLIIEMGSSFKVDRLHGLTAEEAMLIAENNPRDILTNPSSFTVDKHELDTMVSNAMTVNPSWQLGFVHAINIFNEEQTRFDFPKSFKMIYDFTRNKLDERSVLSMTEKMDMVKGLTRVNPEAMEQNPWIMQPHIEQLLKLQTRTARAEYDPWKTDLNPLVRTLETNGYIDPTHPKDFELLVEFVKRFGMNHTPMIAEVFFSLHQHGTDLATTNPLSEFLGKDVPLNSKDKSLLNELEQKQRWMLAELLRDQIPKGLETKIGLELLNLMKGSTSWTQSDTPEQLIAKWKRTAAEKPELAKLPEHYVEYKIEVPLVDRREKTEAEQKDLQTKQAELLVLKTINKEGNEVSTDLGVFVERFMKASADQQEMNDPDWWNKKKRELVEAIYPDFDINQKLEERKRVMEDKGIQGEKRQVGLEAARKAFETQKEKANTFRLALDQIPPLEYSPNVDTQLPHDLIRFMEALAKIMPKGSAADQLFFTLSLEHFERFPSTWHGDLEATKKDLEREKDVRSLANYTFSDLSKFFIEYLSEHYLQPAQDESHTEHAPFSPELLKAHESAWGRTQKDPKKEHMFVKLRDKLSALERGDQTETGKTKKISLVPAKGVMRIFSGDTGDACYTSQHEKLTAGEFPGITAYSFVTNRGTAQERVQGSVLFVETKGDGAFAGKTVLEVRANNPRENLLSQVDADKLVQESLNVAIDLAKQRGIDIVTIPLDPATASSSNRPDVSRYYQAMFGRRTKIQLVNEPETNFNGYDNWDANGMHPNVIVWEKEPDQKIAA